MLPTVRMPTVPSIYISGNRSQQIQGVYITFRCLRLLVDRAQVLLQSKSSIAFVRCAGGVTTELALRFADGMLL